MLLSILLPIRPLISRWKPLSCGSRHRLKRLCNSHAWTLTKRCKDHRTATPVEREIVAWASRTKFIWSRKRDWTCYTARTHTYTHETHIATDHAELQPRIHTHIRFGQTEPFFVTCAIMWELIGFRSIIRPLAIYCWINARLTCESFSTFFFFIHKFQNWLLSTIQISWIVIALLIYYIVR